MIQFLTIISPYRPRRPNTLYLLTYSGINLVEWSGTFHRDTLLHHHFQRLICELPFIGRPRVLLTTRLDITALIPTVLNPYALSLSRRTATDNFGSGSSSACTALPKLR